ncbi:TPA: helix-turn-helix domain-containing protein [Listeria monocytogenes]|nr:helix-turn-helix domain-containing protein [Listeria monocytogenes]
MRNRLIELRKSKTRREVSKDLKITPQMLGAIERGDRTPSLKLANKIANYYDVPIEDIFFDNKDTICVKNERKTKQEVR